MLKHLPDAEKPREKLTTNGASTLSDAELLALFIRHGTATRSALDVARNILVTHGTLGNWLKQNIDSMRKQPGIGPAKATEFLAIREVAQRILREELMKRPLLDAPNLVRQFLQLNLAHESKEQFTGLFLDNQNQLIEYRILATGTIDQAAVYPREVAAISLAIGAKSVIFAHNHPSGCTQPSREDISLTKRLQSALALLDIHVHDHFIVSPSGIHSMAEQGLL